MHVFVYVWISLKEKCANISSSKCYKMDNSVKISYCTAVISSPTLATNCLSLGPHVWSENIYIYNIYINIIYIWYLNI